MRFDTPIRIVWYYGFCEVYARIKMLTDAFENPQYAWWMFHFHKKDLVRGCSKLTKVLNR